MNSTKNEILKLSKMFRTNLQKFETKYPFECFVYKTEIDKDKELEEYILKGFQQIVDGKGFSFENPIEDITVSGLYSIFRIINSDYIRKKSDYSHTKEGYIMDVFDLQIDKKGWINIFHKISTSTYK
jgi:hypothetical protein